MYIYIRFKNIILTGLYWKVSFEIKINSWTTKVKVQKNTANLQIRDFSNFPHLIKKSINDLVFIQNKIWAFVSIINIIYY